MQILKVGLVILQLKGKMQILKVGLILDLFLLQPGHSGWQCVGESAGQEHLEIKSQRKRFLGLLFLHALKKASSDLF